VYSLTELHTFGLQASAKELVTIDSIDSLVKFAYGVEIDAFVHSVEFYDVETKMMGYFNNKECEFSYRDSQQMLRQHPMLPHYEAPEGKVKIPAAWLIEQCGFKGMKEGDIACHENQALVQCYRAMPEYMFNALLEKYLK